MRILIVEDDSLVATQILKLLKKQYVVDHVESRAAAEYLMEINDYDLAILDLGLPDGAGLELCQLWRDSDLVLPCLMLSAHIEMPNKLQSFAVGADDFLEKPFHPEELLSRIRALLRRAPHYHPPTYHLGDCHFDSANKQLRYHNHCLQLNCKEGQLLEILLRHQGSIVTRSMIIEHVWENSDDMETNTIEVHISRLRRRMRKQFSFNCIKTIRNVGYLIPHDLSFTRSIHRDTSNTRSQHVRHLSF